MTIDPRYSDHPRICEICEVSDTHPYIARHCGPCNLDFLADNGHRDDELVMRAEDLGEPVITIEAGNACARCNELLTEHTRGEWTKDICLSCEGAYLQRHVTRTTSQQEAT